jgi:hypothetical protein
MAKKIAVSRVVSPRYLKTYVFEHGATSSSTSKRRLEVYTGWIPIGVGSGDLVQEEIVSFLPTNGTNVVDYQNASLAGNVHSQGVDVTVTVAPSHVRTSDGFSGIVAVDDASAKLEIQPQGLSEAAKCLILRVKVGTSHANLEAITYQVTVLSNVKEHGGQAGQTDEGTRPVNLSPTAEPV